MARNVIFISCLLFISFVVPTLSIASEETENKNEKFGCNTTADSRPADHFTYAVFCNVQANNGFETLWLPGDDAVSLTLNDRNDQVTGLLFRAFWIRAAAPEVRNVRNTSERFVERIRDKRREIESVRELEGVATGGPNENLQSQIKGLEDELSAILFELNDHLQDNEAAILRQDVENNNRVLIITAPNPTRNLIEEFDLLVVGLPTAVDQKDTQAYITLANSSVSSKSIARQISIVTGSILTIGFFAGIFPLFGSWRPFKGINGRLSLSSAQIAMFSVITFTLSLYVFLRTGTLGDLSEDVLLLIGIVAGGTAGAKVTHRFTQRLQMDTWLWLKESKWLKENEDYNWNQLFKDSKGEFDIFRFQAVMFSILVASYLVAVGSVGLASVDIPDGVMGILGLSQVTYIGGKALGGQPKWKEFDDIIKSIRNGTAAPFKMSDNSEISAVDKAKLLFEELFGYPPKATQAAS